jgi:hypothetical protein
MGFLRTMYCAESVYGSHHTGAVDIYAGDYLFALPP